MPSYSGIALPHTYKPPTFYAVHEGDNIIPWPGTDPLLQYIVETMEWLRLMMWRDLGHGLPCILLMPSYHNVLQAPITLYGLLWVRYGDRPEDYVIQEQWDCHNGFTYPIPISSFLERLSTNKLCS